MKKLLAFKEAHLSGEDGASLVEFALIAVGIALAVVAVMYTFSDQLHDLFAVAGTAADSASKTENAAH